MNIDRSKFDNPLQVGGIRTGTLDYPNPHGGQACRVAHFNTGSGLRFTVALDRGGDIVEAAYNDCNLAYLTANDYKPPSHAYHRGLDWLIGWPGGLMTTAGPAAIGEPRAEAGQEISLHGRHSNTPAAVEAIVNPEPADDQWDLRIELRVRDTRMFGPCLEVRRTISCSLGESTIAVRDVVTNRGDQPTTHAMLYHVNFGYPLLDTGARLVYGGRGTVHDGRGDAAMAESAEQLQTVPPPSDAYGGAREQVVVVEPTANDDGQVAVGLVNRQRRLGVELTFRAEQLPRLAHWLHYGPRGSYVAALEPFYGSLFGSAVDHHQTASARLAPGESREYDITFAILTTAEQLAALQQRAGPLVL